LTDSLEGGDFRRKNTPVERNPHISTDHKTFVLESQLTA
jgi:hypothetical protein